MGRRREALKRTLPPLKGACSGQTGAFNAPYRPRHIAIDCIKSVELLNKSAECLQDFEAYY